MGQSNGKTPRYQREGLPSNIMAERMLLGGVLVSGDYAVLGELDGSDFTTEQHRQLFGAMRSIADRGGALDTTTLFDELLSRREVESAGGLGYMADLMSGMPNLRHFDDYRNIVRDKSINRQIVYRCEFLREAATTGNVNVDQLIEQGGQAFEALKALCGPKQTRGLQPPPSVWTWESELSYLVDQMIPEAGVTLVSGESGDGKSTFALGMAAAVAMGKPFLGRETKQRRVLYFDRENPPAIVKDRLFRMRIPDISDVLWIYGRWGGVEPPGPDRRDVIEFVKRERPLMAYDSLIAFAGCDENSADQMRRHMEHYRRLAGYGASIVIIHHSSDKTPKGEREREYRGSSDIRASVDVAWRLKRDDSTCGGDPLGALSLRAYKTRGEPMKPVAFRWAGDSFESFNQPKPKLSEYDRVIELAVRFPDATQGELWSYAQAEGFRGRDKFYGFLTKAVLDGRLEIAGGVKSTRCFRAPGELLNGTA